MNQGLPYRLNDNSNNLPPFLWQVSAIRDQIRDHDQRTEEQVCSASGTAVCVHALSALWYRWVNHFFCFQYFPFNDITILPIPFKIIIDAIYFILIILEDLNHYVNHYAVNVLESIHLFSLDGFGQLIRKLRSLNILYFSRGEIQITNVQCTCSGSRLFEQEKIAQPGCVIR